VRALEIGCGESPITDPGWEHLDLRPFPHVEHVQPATDLSNFSDDTFDRIAAKDVIEHIGWALVPVALSEWVRVLKPGGVLEVETPNAKEIVELIANPGDPTLPRWGGESDWARFSRVTFGHQDCPENHHASYFTWEWLTDLLYGAGAGHVETMWCTLARFRLRASK
jgi:SAM-dependent methyltransferase